MTPGQVVEVGRNDCAVPPGTRGVWLGTVPETGCALVLLPGGRRVSLLAEQWRVEGGEWAGPRTLAGEPLPPPARRSPRRVGCEVPGCDGKHMARGLCSRHYEQRRRAERRQAAPPAVPAPAPKPVPRSTKPRSTAKPARVCTVPGCEREHRAHGWCQMHYRRWLATGDPLGLRRTGPGTCSVPGCDRTVRARGWCRAHYRRWLATGDVRPDEPVGSRHGPASRTCSVPGCDRTHVARGLCATHYSRGQRRGFGADLSSRPPTSPAVCTVPGCGREHHGRGLCRMHYSRLRRTGSTGEATPRKWPAREAA